MSVNPILRLGSIKSVAHFKQHLASLRVAIPCDHELKQGQDSPFRQALVKGKWRIGNRIAIQPMEGWDALADGNPSEKTIRRWQRFGTSGAKLIWGGEAVAVSHEGRANPNQLVAAPHTEANLALLRKTLIEEHRLRTGSDDGLLIGLQLTHSGRYCRPNQHDKAEPKILYRHPFLDRRLNLPADYPVLADSEIECIVEKFHVAAQIAARIGFDFVDIKHCHGYLGHEFLSAHTREGRYGGSFENRTRFLREVVQGIRAFTPELEIGVRLSAFDSIPFHPDPSLSLNGKPGPGIPDTWGRNSSYTYGFGVDTKNPVAPDWGEPIQFLSLLQELGIHLVNITAGSPYYNPHIQRPALYPPSDGYLPPEDPLIGVAHQMDATRLLKQRFPHLVFVGTAYSYLQDFLPHVAQAALLENWVDMIGLGRMVLSYPEILWDASEGRPMQRKKICRTFSDCTTAPRKGMPSGCYPLDGYYKDSELAKELIVLKKN